MLKRLNNWYKTLTPVKRVFISFVLNWLYWLAAWLIAEQFFFDEKRSLKYHLFHATWMAFFMTALSNWKTIKSILRSEKEHVESD